MLAGVPIQLGRMGVRFDDRGVTIRNFWRTRRLNWDEVSYLADGGSRERWVLRVMGRHRRRPITASATRSRVDPATGTIEPETLALIGRVAKRFRVSLDITGRPPAPRRQEQPFALIGSEPDQRFLVLSDAWPEPHRKNAVCNSCAQ